MSKTIRVYLLKVNYGNYRGSFIAFKKIPFFSLARGQKKPKTKLMTQEIIKLSNALSWLLQSQSLKEEGRGEGKLEWYIWVNTFKNFKTLYPLGL